ncbi:nucleotidyltransferase family protein [Amylibacter sp.]|nr:nucleotidyltransferase family protein [Amylibacter sp.]MDC1413555.1 nucleotidyltransferase family protein [Amylibacter sp.]
MISKSTNIFSLLISDSSSIEFALRAIDLSEKQIALIINDDHKLVATITDGDVRRALLGGANLSGSISDIMQRDFKFVTVGDDPIKVKDLMTEYKLSQIPELDENGHPIALFYKGFQNQRLAQDSHVFLMAGGQGARLRPLTYETPKPMLKLGGKPILEHILNDFIQQGFSKFTIAINYKAEVIKDYFGNGSKLGISIDYLEETKRLGTGGALSLLKDRPTGPFIVMNSDLLAEVDFAALLKQHSTSVSEATICCTSYNVEVPYGVIQSENSEFEGIVEKPIHSHLINAGAYVLSPNALNYLQFDEYIDMPSLLEKLVEAGKTVSTFEIDGLWIDIGRISDFERAQTAFDHSLLSK